MPYDRLVDLNLLPAQPARLADGPLPSWLTTCGLQLHLWQVKNDLRLYLGPRDSRDPSPKSSSRNPAPAPPFLAREYCQRVGHDLRLSELGYYLIRRRTEGEKIVYYFDLNMLSLEQSNELLRLVGDWLVSIPTGQARTPGCLRLLDQILESWEHFYSEPENTTGQDAYYRLLQRLVDSHHWDDTPVHPERPAGTDRKPATYSQLIQKTIAERGQLIQKAIARCGQRHFTLRDFLQQRQKRMVPP